MTTTELRADADERALGNGIAERALRDDNQQLSEKQIEAARAATRRIAATIGDIVAVLSRDPKYHGMALKDLHAEILPAVALGRCAVAYSDANPFAVRHPIAVVVWSADATHQAGQSAQQVRVIIAAGHQAACDDICRELGKLSTGRGETSHE